MRPESKGNWGTLKSRICIIILHENHPKIYECLGLGALRFSGGWYLPSLLPSSYPPRTNYVPLFFFPISLSASCRWLADVGRILLDIPGWRGKQTHGAVTSAYRGKGPLGPGVLGMGPLKPTMFSIVLHFSHLLLSFLPECWLIRWVPPVLAIWLICKSGGH